MAWVIPYAKNKKTLPSKSLLEEQYMKMGETIASLARTHKVSDATMKTWLCIYGIERKSMKQNKAEKDQIDREKKINQNV